MYIDPTLLINIAAGPDDVVNSTLFTTLIQVAAYITPYFLIPAAFKAGMGVFGALTGMLNDRSRGFFDKQRKYRQGKMDYNRQRLKAGERYNNRGLNALTSRASTRNLGFGKTGSMAYQQKINNASADFGKTAAGQAVQHNDGALQALTYGSKAAAYEGLRRGDFGTKTDAEIRDSVAAAEASGGFGRNRQVFAAAQLSRTGTGYENLEQVAKTIARASNGNTSQAAALAGDINASTKQANRYDLAPGFGKLNGLANAEMNNGASLSDYHSATVAAARGVDAVSLLRGKPAQVKQLTQALSDHAQANRLILNDTTGTYSSAQKTAAKDELIQTVGQIDQLSQSKSYASHDNQEHVNKLLDDTQRLRTQEMDTLLGRTYDTSGNRTDSHTVTDPATGKTVTIPIPGSGVTQEQIDSRERYDQTRAPRGYDPNNPNNQP